MKALPFEKQPLWVIKAISNGCGGKGSIIDPPDGRYGGCCDRHDLLYTIGGTEEDRNFADGEFLIDMISIGVEYKRGLARLGYILTAIFYFYSVVFFGKKFFRYGTQLSQEQLEEYAKTKEKEKEEGQQVVHLDLLDPDLADKEKRALPPIGDTDLEELRERLKDNE